jgi:hypothetical protein
MICASRAEACHVGLIGGRMAVDQQWMLDHFGADAEPGVAARVAEHVLVGAPSDVEFERGLIEFDSEAKPEPQAFLADATQGPPTLKHMVAIPWPDGEEPQPSDPAVGDGSLPPADVLIVTWTTDEGHALSRVLTPGFDSHPPGPHDTPEPGMQYWRKYTKNYDALSATMSPLCPARQYKRLGTYLSATIAGRSVTMFKSDSHFSQDGSRELATTPNRKVWEQIIADVKPKLVITTGTAGGIGAASVVGDVIVSRFVAFQPRNAATPSDLFDCAALVPGRPFANVHALIKPNARFLPGGSGGPAPKIHNAGKTQRGVLTTGGFAYDDSANTDHLEGHGLACEMGDAVLGLVCQEMGSSAPDYVCVRNVSDPQIDASDGTPQQQRARAAAIYKAYGKWSSVCSAIVCAAIVAALQP